MTVVPGLSEPEPLDDVHVSKRDAARALATALDEQKVDCHLSITPKGDTASIVVTYVGGLRRGEVVTFAPLDGSDRKGWRKLVKLANAIHCLI